MKILEYELVKITAWAPEQYHVFHHGKNVGYLRLRHGYFAAYRSEDEMCVNPLYEANTLGDGEFMDDERKFHLTKAVKAIRHDIKRKLRHAV